MRCKIQAGYAVGPSWRGSGSFCHVCAVRFYIYFSSTVSAQSLPLFRIPRLAAKYALRCHMAIGRAKFQSGVLARADCARLDLHCLLPLPRFKVLGLVINDGGGRSGGEFWSWFVH